MPCAPLINKKDLIEAAKKLKNKKALTTVTENLIPIEWSYKIKGGFLKPIFSEKMKKIQIYLVKVIKKLEYLLVENHIF